MPNSDEQWITDYSDTRVGSFSMLFQDKTIYVENENLIIFSA